MALWGQQGTALQRSRNKRSEEGALEQSGRATTRRSFLTIQKECKHLPMATVGAKYSSFLLNRAML